MNPEVRDVSSASAPRSSPSSASSWSKQTVTWSAETLFFRRFWRCKRKSRLLRTKQRSEHRELPTTLQPSFRWRLLVGGLERVYELGRRSETRAPTSTYNPEFTPMEAYAALLLTWLACASFPRTSSRRLSVRLAAARRGHEVITYQAPKTYPATGALRPWQRLPEVTGEVIDTPVEKPKCSPDRYEIEWNPEWQAGKLLFEIYDELGEKSIKPNLCLRLSCRGLAHQAQADDPRLTDRFELIVCGAEYANAALSSTIPLDQEERFAAQMEAKRQGDEGAMEYDYDLSAHLQYGMPPAGWHYWRHRPHDYALLRSAFTRDAFFPTAQARSARA